MKTFLGKNDSGRRVETPKMARCNGVEIFAAGLYRGKRYKIHDLDEIVNNFNRLGPDGLKLLRPPAVIGHEEDQKFLERSDLPAAAWPERLRRRGSKLIADFEEVPMDIAKAINSRAFRKVSAEIYDDFEDDEGKSYGMALRRVAILGGDIPQVKSLADIPFATYNESLIHVRPVGAVHCRGSHGGYWRAMSERTFPVNQGRVFKASELPPGVFAKFAMVNSKRKGAGQYWVPDGEADTPDKRVYGQAAKRAAAAAAAKGRGEGLDDLPEDENDEDEETGMPRWAADLTARAERGEITEDEKENAIARWDKLSPKEKASLRFGKPAPKPRAKRAPKPRATRAPKPKEPANLDSNVEAFMGKVAELKAKNPKAYAKVQASLSESDKQLTAMMENGGDGFFGMSPDQKKALAGTARKLTTNPDLIEALNSTTQATSPQELKKARDGFIGRLASAGGAAIKAVAGAASKALRFAKSPRMKSILKAGGHFALATAAMAIPLAAQIALPAVTTPVILLKAALVSFMGWHAGQTAGGQVVSAIDALEAPTRARKAKISERRAEIHRNRMDKLQKMSPEDARAWIKKKYGTRLSERKRRIFRMSELPPGVFESFAWVESKRKKGSQYWVPEGKSDSPENRIYGQAAKDAAAAAGASQGAQPKSAAQEWNGTPEQAAKGGAAIDSAADEIAKTPPHKLRAAVNALGSMIPTGAGVPSYKTMRDAVNQIASADNVNAVKAAAKGLTQNLIKGGASAVKFGVQAIGTIFKKLFQGGMAGAKWLLNTRAAKVIGAVGLKVAAVAAIGVGAAAVATMPASAPFVFKGAAALMGTYAGVKGFFALNRRANMAFNKAAVPDATPEELAYAASKSQWDRIATRAGSFTPGLARVPQPGVMGRLRGYFGGRGGVNQRDLDPPEEPRQAPPRLRARNGTRGGVNSRRLAESGTRVFKMSELPPGVFEKFAWHKGPRAQYWLPEGAADEPKNRRYGQAAKKAAAAAGAGGKGGEEAEPDDNLQRQVNRGLITQEEAKAKRASNAAAAGGAKPAPVSGDDEIDPDFGLPNWRVKLEGQFEDGEITLQQRDAELRRRLRVKRTPAIKKPATKAPAEKPAATQTPAAKPSQTIPPWISAKGVLTPSMMPLGAPLPSSDELKEVRKLPESERPAAMVELLGKTAKGRQALIDEAAAKLASQDAKKRAGPSAMDDFIKAHGRVAAQKARQKLEAMAKAKQAEKDAADNAMWGPRTDRGPAVTGWGSSGGGKKGSITGDPLVDLLLLGSLIAG